MSASIIASVITGGTNSHQTVSEELNNVATDFVSQGVIGTFTSGSPNTGAFAVTQDTGSDMAVAILSGRAYVAGTPSGQDAQILSARMTSNYSDYTINSNSSGSTRYDWIYLSFSATNASTPDSAADNVITLYTSRSTSNATDNGSPPTYGLLLAVVTVANGASSITNGNITDKRVQSQLSVQSSATTGWQTLGFPLTYGANNGNKEFTVTTPNNLTGILSPGMKLNITRSVTPPTQCMAFASASSQYATKASPTGITFTSAFTCEAWIYLLSYNSSPQCIVSRRSANTSGWELQVNSSGQVVILYFDGSSNVTSIESYQSVPLNRWVHVAGVVTSTSSKAGAVYVNGVLAPTTFAASSAASLTQAGNLSIGMYGAATGDPLNGYISECRVWSVGQTQSAIQASMAINLVGNETNLVGLWQGSGNFTDATSNANTLTATNGASSAQANNPYSAIEYAIISKVSFSNPTTTLTLSTGDTCTIPNQTLNTPQYSVAQEPFGLPSDLSSSIGRRLCYIPINAGDSFGTSPGQLHAINQYSMTVPGNCNKVKVYLNFPNISNTNGTGNTVFVYNGSATTSNAIFTFSQSNSIAICPAFEVSVVPGTSFLLNILAECGLGSMGISATSAGAPQEQGVWVEAT